MGNVLVNPPRSEIQRMRAVEQQLGRQVQRIKCICRTENLKLSRLQTRLNETLSKPESTIRSLECKQLASEIAFIIHNQESLALCFDHLTSLTRIVRQLKSGRFVHTMVRNVNTVVQGLEVPDAARSPDAGMQDIMSELTRSRALWEEQSRHLENMLKGEQGTTSTAATKHLQSIQDAILEEATAAHERGVKLDDVRREERYQQLAQRLRPQPIVPAAS